MYQNVFRSLDPVTGRPDIDPAKQAGDRRSARTSVPALHGGKNWPPIAFSPQHADDLHPRQQQPVRLDHRHVPVQYTPGAAVRRRARQPAVRSSPAPITVGEVQAWNVDTGQRVWTHNYDKSPNWGAMLVTGGGLVFSGGTERSQVPRVRCVNGQAAVGVSDQLRHPGAADDVQGRWQAVHGRGVGLGRRLARDAGDAQSTVSRRVSRSARGRRGLGVCDRVKAKGKGQRWSR